MAPHRPEGDAWSRVGEEGGAQTPHTRLKTPPPVTVTGPHGPLRRRGPILLRVVDDGEVGPPETGGPGRGTLRGPPDTLHRVDGKEQARAPDDEVLPGETLAHEAEVGVVVVAVAPRDAPVGCGQGAV